MSDPISKHVGLVDRALHLSEEAQKVALAKPLSMSELADAVAKLAQANQLLIKVLRDDVN